ncbi:hypothetical protein [Pectobacterium aroidearum]|uniref:hypothetical protein n=1 Tax=Pectobacterium aroidearum TaxID=1201031 RepID=UPI001CD75888|nr:hypothetical protein [Pectobacterium aroidearum]
MKITATFSHLFLQGDGNTPFAVDGPFLTEEERLTIAEFMKDLGEGKPLRGKNKPSWVNDDHEDIPGSEAYKDLNYWHYHCGTTWNEATFKGMTIDLKFNPNGMHSNECIHYIKESDSKITIVGYSREHVPFLSPNDKRNPFFSDDEEE